MTDVEFDDLRHGGDRRDIVEGEAMAGMHLQPEAGGRCGAFARCGEMAGQPRSVLALFGMGLRRFSMSPAFVPTIKALLASVTTTQAERFAHQILQLKTSEEIRGYLTARLHEVSSTLEVFDSG